MESLTKIRYRERAPGHPSLCACSNSGFAAHSGHGGLASWSIKQKALTIEDSCECRLMSRCSSELRSRFRCSANAAWVLEDEEAEATIDTIEEHASSKSFCKLKTRVVDAAIIDHRR